MDSLRAMRVFARVIGEGGFAAAARTRVLQDFLLEIFGGEDRDPWLAAAGCQTPLNARLGPHQKV